MKNEFTLTVSPVDEADEQELRALFGVARPLLEELKESLTVLPELSVLVGPAKSLQGTGCILQYQAPSPRLGMTATDVFINLGLSFVAGIPASIIANYLWEQIAKRGKRSMSINRHVAKSFNDVRRWVIHHNPFANTVADVGDALHLHRLKISSFRNLRDLEICFDAYVDGDSGEDTASRLKSHAIIGQNIRSFSLRIYSPIIPVVTNAWRRCFRNIKNASVVDRRLRMKRFCPSVC